MEILPPTRAAVAAAPATEPEADRTGAGAGAQLSRSWMRRRAIAILSTPALLIALCLLSLAFFWRVVLLHEILLPGDILYAHDPLWRSQVPPSFKMASNPLDADALTEFYPWTVLAAQALHRGVIPLWNPYAFAGTPFLAAMQTAVLYPLNLLLIWLLSPADVLGLRAIIHLALTLTGTFLFARRLEMSRPAALLAAVSFGLSAPVVVWLEHPIAGAVAWLPWLLLCIDRTIASEGHAGWAAATAAAIALELLAGHEESALHALLLCVAYALLRAALARRHSGLRRAARGLVSALAAGLLGAALSAAFLLPVLAHLPLTEAAADRTLGAAGIGPAGTPAMWPSLAVAAVPDYFGNPTWGLTLPGSGAFNENALYIGAVPMVLAIVAVLRRRDARTLFLALGALVALGIAAQWPLLGMLNDLPVLRIVSNGRLRIEYALLMALLAGYGLDALRRDGALRSARRALSLWGATTLVLAGGAAVALSAARPYGWALPPATVAGAALPLLWLGLFGAVLWTIHGRRRGHLLLWSLTPALVAVDLCTFGIGYHTTVPRAVAQDLPPAVRAIARDRSLYRIAGLGETLMPSFSTSYGLQDIRGYDPAYSAAYERFFTGVFSATTGMRLGLAALPLSPARLRGFDLLNVTYLFVACDKPVRAPPSYRLLYSGSGCVYRNTAALPRALLLHHVARMDSARAIAALRDGTVNPRQVALLDPATSAGAHWDVAPSDGSGESVRVTSYDLNDVRLRVHARDAGLLVLADAYAPGWQATIDGHDTPIARADAIFRAVKIAPGDHVVTFAYRPLAFTVGVAISLAACAPWLALLLVAVRRGIARRSTRPLAPLAAGTDLA